MADKSFLKSVAAVAFLLLCASPSPCAQSDVWTAFMRVLPSRVLPRDAGLNTALYVLKQTHEPLFRIDDGENYTSRLLLKWSRSIDSSEYLLCPDTRLAFGNGQRFNLDFFKGYISKLLPGFSGNGKVETEGGCVKVSFSGGRRDFLRYLALYENSPSIRINPNVESGLGPFEVEAISGAVIKLKRKKKVDNGYNAIVIRKYSGLADMAEFGRGISDFNKIPEKDVPGSVKERSLHFDAVTLKTIVLIINWPDKKLRDVLYNCIDVDKFRRVYYPGQTEFLDVANILPVGVPGGRAGRPMQNCSKPDGLKSPSSLLTFVDLTSSNTPGLEKFFSEFTRRTGIKVAIKKIKDTEIARTFFTYPREYNLVVVAMDAVRPDHSAFFDYVIKKNGYFDFRIPELPSLYSKLLLSCDPTVIASLGRELAERIGSDHVVLPLFQVRRRFYYPDKIKNLVVGRGFLEYPEIADFRW